MKIRTVLIPFAIAILGASAWAQGTATDSSAAKPMAPATASMPTQAAAPGTTAMPPQTPTAKMADKHKVVKAKHKKPAAKKKMAHKPAA